jgi:hypothetical protein
MSNYTQSTNFATKDALPSGDPLKIVKGTEINTEFNNIATAVATKADLASPTFTGNVTGTFVGNVTGNVTGSAGTVTTITTTQVLNAAAGASLGAVGTYAFLKCVVTGTYPSAPGETAAASELFYVGINTADNLTYTSGASSPSGTWRCMGVPTVTIPGLIGPDPAVSVWLRIS